MRNTKHSIYTSLISLLLCISMLLGTTFAWFTDVVSSNGNVIQSGNLQAQMFYSDTFLDENDAGWKNASDEAVFTHNNWEPGYTDLKYVKIYNDGSLNFKWKLTVEADGPVTELADVIDVYYVNPATNEITSLAGLDSVGTLTEVMSEKTNNTGRLTPGQSAILAIAFHMQESANNDYQGKSLCDNGFSLKLIAAQDVGEDDSFSDDYDAGADWDEGTKNFSASAPLSQVPIIYGATAGNITIGGENGMNAYIPSGVKIAEGAESLDLAINTVDGNDNLTLDDGDSAVNMDVHIYGVADDNTVPMIVNLGAILPSQLDATEVKLYHTENGTPVQMTRVASANDFSIHNQFTYNAETGDVSIYVANFSVFSAVKTNAELWDGTSDTSWYNENDTEFTLTTAEQFAGFRTIVDGGYYDADWNWISVDQDTFEGKTITLGADIDLANIQFDPIGFGYANKGGQVFMGTFDGGNHTIYNLNQNCWLLDPDKTNYSTYTYSTAGAGLFASIKDATVKNIAICGAEIVFECVDMGVLVGYAQGECTFENIIITNSKIGNYNRYTGGVVGEVSFGPYGTDTSLGYSHIFKNITVDSTVKVCGLWGSFGCGMGGVIGGKWNDATVYMENVISAPVMDVYNDVVSAYQWYAFRGCGMLIGHTEEPYSDGRTSGIATASFLTCKNVKVYYGDWVNYTYYEFANQDSGTGRSYPWVRAEAGEYCDAFSNIRYGVPTHNGVKVSDLTEEELKHVATNYTPIVFDQLYGADRGMYGQAEHAGVTVIDRLGETKTIYISNLQGWENLKLHYWYRNGNDTWTNISEYGVSMDVYETAVNNVYKLTLPAYVDGFKITADGGNEVEFTLAKLSNGNTYDLDKNSLNVAKVNDKFYATLKEAIENANGGTVTLVSDVALQESIVIDGETVTIDLNGKTIGAADNAKIVEVLLAKNDANVTITGNGTMIAKGQGDDVEYVEVISAIDGATVTIKGGSFISYGCTAIYATRNAKVFIYDGYFEASEKYYGRYYTLDVNEAEANRGTIAVYGGTYKDFNPANHTIDGKNYQNKLANSCFKSNYDASEQIYTVVSNHNFVNGTTCVCGAYKTQKWELVTDASSLAAGDKIIIVAANANYALGAIQGSNNRPGVAIVKNTDGTVTINENVQIITLESTENIGTFAFNVGTGYLYAAASSSNQLKTQTTNNKNGYWTITLTNGITSIIAKSSSNRNVMQYNPNTNYDSPLFSCYASASQGVVAIYKLSSIDESIVESHDCNVFANGAYCGKNANCTFCGNEVANTALEHNYEVVETEATCFNGGYITNTCSRCNDNYVTYVTDALGHNYVDGVCSRCGNKTSEKNAWQIVTDVSNLQTGDKIVIVAKDFNYALSTTQNNNNRAQAAVIKDKSSITFGDDVQIITLENGSIENTFAFKVDNGYLYAASSSSNHLKTQTTNNKNGIWTINIDAEGVATIKAQGTSTHNWLRYNSTNNPPIFSCYGSGQADVVIYKLVSDTNGDTPCAHANTTTATTATCTETGTQTVTCDDCGATVSTEETDALGHTTENGECERCGQTIGGEAPVAQYVKITDASEFTTGTYVLIVNSKNVTVSTYDGSWIKGSTLNAGDVIEKSQGDSLAITLEVTDSGVKIKIGDKYVKPKSGNSNGITAGEYTWAYEFKDDGTVVFKGVGSDTTTLAYNVQSSGFRAYKNSTVSSDQYPSFFTVYKLVNA